MMKQLLIFKHWWAIFVILTCLNGASFWSLSKNLVRNNDEAHKAVRELVLGFLFWGNVPWVVMGIGLTYGGVPSLWQYFRPQDGNPYVLAWFASGVVIWILGVYWVFQRGSADMLARHFFFLHRAAPSTTSVKILFMLGGVTMLFGIVLLIILDPSVSLPGQ